MSFSSKLYMVLAAAVEANPGKRMANAVRFIRERYKDVPAAKVKARIVALDDLEAAFVELARHPNNADAQKRYDSARKRMILHLSRTGL